MRHSSTNRRPIKVLTVAITTLLLFSATSLLSSDNIITVSVVVYVSPATYDKNINPFSFDCNRVDSGV
jgi:hypothetical protein